MILSLEQSVPEHQKSHFRRLFIITLTMVTLLYIAFGVSGYLSYGPNTRDIITLNLPHNPKGMDFAALVKYCLCFSLIFTYPVMMFPVTTILHQRLKMWNCCSCINTVSKNYVHKIITFICIELCHNIFFCEFTLCHVFFIGFLLVDIS